MAGLDKTFNEKSRGIELRLFSYSYLNAHYKNNENYCTDFIFSTFYSIFVV